MNSRFGSIMDYWWVALLNGIIALAFGLAIFIWPGITLDVLILLFGVFALLYGIVLAVHSIMVIGRDEGWWLKLIEGIIGIGAGLSALFWPGLTTVLLLYIIAFFSFFEGMVMILYGIIFRRGAGNALLMITGGAFSVIFGILLAIFPMSGALVLIKVIGIFEILFGILLILYAIDLLSEKSSKPHVAEEV